MHDCHYGTVDVERIEEENGFLGVNYNKNMLDKMIKEGIIIKMGM